MARLLPAAAVVCAVGVGVAAKIIDIHSKLERLGSGYTSFCNINSSINCDAVLASGFANIAGFPVAWMALAAYLGLAALFAFAWRRPGPTGYLALRLAAVGVVGSLVFSAYMAFVSFFVLKTACIMCLSLYAVVIVLAVLTFLIGRAHARGLPELGEPLTAKTAAAVALAAAATVIVLALASWPQDQAVANESMSLDEIRAADPKFYDWYTSLPVAQAAALPAGGARVAIVEFSDFGCGHCRRSHDLLKDLLARRGDQIDLIHRDFPLDSACNEVLTYAVHPGACRAAEAAECARAQGRYADMADRLFANQDRFFEAAFFNEAEKLRLDMAVFRKCMDSHETLPGIVEDCRLGGELKLTSTPTLYINRRRVEGTLENPAAYDYAVMIELQLAAGHKLSPTP